MRQQPMFRGARLATQDSFSAARLEPIYQALPCKSNRRTPGGYCGLGGT
jgi:hypothetical protein